MLNQYSRTSYTTERPVTKLAFSKSYLLEHNFISKKDLDSLTDDKLEILRTVTVDGSFLSQEKIQLAISCALLVWQYPYNGSYQSQFDEAILRCSFEIVSSGYGKENALHRLNWCHKIQNSLDDSDIESGWRVSFHKKNYYYVNHMQELKKIITFHHGRGE